MTSPPSHSYTKLGTETLPDRAPANRLKQAKAGVARARARVARKAKAKDEEREKANLPYPVSFPKCNPPL